MIKNIPSRMQPEQLETLITSRGFCKAQSQQESSSTPSYDFIKLVLDKAKKKSNKGFAFINLLSQEAVLKFYNKFENLKWSELGYNTTKVVKLTFAKEQLNEAV